MENSTVKEKHPVRFYKNADFYPALDLGLIRPIIGDLSVQEIPIGPVILKRLELALTYPDGMWTYFGFQTVKPIDFNPKMVDDKYTSIQFKSKWLVITLRHGLYFKGYWPGPGKPFIPCVETWQKLLFYPVSIIKVKEIVLITNVKPVDIRF